ncbi:hypothetical protein CAPTEDRAFT_123695 [Capitella teleta]|uniref:Tryptophan synthase beta chain-like PALP domain-containing protein n=1 Tax=Capitella teleta TaxID=283909 RepID=R7TIC6_CAPTE|nr:hypothetical protein CAPTEDRAFT_123695 [Capitella teleta]|eukprot:ELT93489.1 hypothetical protein CAPTEDRAFT_123695 [Capitella teleta]
MPVGIRSNSLIAYTPPSWAEKLKNVPTHRIQLGHLNTPVHSWKLPGLPRDVQLAIKRDDMTGSTLGGNKIRKLEFLFADALQKGCRHVITCGGLQSNHCRAVAVACAQLGLKCHLVLRSGLKDVKDAGCEGNVFLDKMMGASLYYVPTKAEYTTELLPRMQTLADKIRDDSGEDSYLMEVGGSSDVGFYGYVEAFHELEQQGVLDSFDDIVFACGSGGTAEGLAVANHLTGSKLRVHGVAVCDDAIYFHNHCNTLLAQVGLTDIRSEDILNIIEGAKGLGYGLSQQPELDFVSEIAMSTGIVLDPVYTGKAVLGFLNQLKANSSVFKGKRILYIHTGSNEGIVLWFSMLVDCREFLERTMVG